MKLGKSRILLVLVASLVAIAMVATGCSGDSGTDDGGKEAVKVKIGVGAPLTAGAVALGKGMERGTNLAIAQANESDKAKELGITFESVPGDDQGDPKTAVTVANTFASTSGLVGVMGHLNSGCSIPASKVYATNNIVQVSPASTNPALTLQGLKNVFRVCTIDTVQGSFAADKAFKDLGFKSAYVVDDSTPYGEGLAKFFAEQFAANGGKVLGTAKTSDKDTDFNALATKIAAAKPDVLYYGGIYNAGALLAKQAKEAGVTGPFFSGDGLFDPEFINLAGAPNAEGAFCTSIGLPLDQLPEGQAFQEAFKDMYPNEEIAAYDAYSYDAANVIIDAVFAVADELGASAVTSVEGKKKIIETVAKTDKTGVSGQISFDANGDTTNKAVTLYQVKNGEWGAYAQ